MDILIPDWPSRHPRRRRLIRRARWRAGAMVLGALIGAAAFGQPIDEYQVKAAFLFNFAKFVEWPPQAFKGPGDPISICVIGHNPFGSMLEEAVHGKVVEDRPLVVHQLSDPRQVSGCHIVFVSMPERKLLRPILKELSAGGVLTVGETEGFTAEGGVVNFKVEDNRVRFEINMNAAGRQKLRISSKLLSLAQVVKK